MTNNEIIISEAIKHGIYTKAEAQAIVAAKGCLPIHTFAEWKKAGYSVKRGEHAAITCDQWKYTERPGMAAKAARAEAAKAGQNGPDAAAPDPAAAPIPVPQTISRDARAGMGGAAATGAAVGLGAATGIASNMASTRAPQRPLAQLVDVVSGESHSITSAQVTIGRERSVSDIALRDPNVSRRHAQLTFPGADCRARSSIPPTARASTTAALRAARCATASC